MDAPNLTITSETIDGVEIITISGRLDASASAPLKAKLDEVITGGTHKIALDLSGMTYIGSAGLREFFLAGKNLARVKGAMVLFALQAPVQRIFDISGLPTSYPIVATRDEALARLNA